MRSLRNYLRLSNQSTLFPEIAVRLVRLNIEEGKDTMFDLDCLFDARKILAFRQMHGPFWGNLKTMRSILETTKKMIGNDFGIFDIYDLLTIEQTNAVITFDYYGMKYRLDIFPHEGEIIYQYGGRWFHGPEDFLERARIADLRFTTVFMHISNIEIFDRDES